MHELTELLSGLASRSTCPPCGKVNDDVVFKSVLEPEVSKAIDSTTGVEPTANDYDNRDDDPDVKTLNLHQHTANDRDDMPFIAPAAPSPLLAMGGSPWTPCMTFRSGDHIKVVSKALLQNVVGRDHVLELPAGSVLESLSEFGTGGFRERQRFRVLSCGSVGCIQHMALITVV